MYGAAATNGSFIVVLLEASTIIGIIATKFLGLTCCWLIASLYFLTNLAQGT